MVCLTTILIRFAKSCIRGWAGFQRMAYLVQFDANRDVIESSLSVGIHVLNLKSRKGATKDKLLGELFRKIRAELEVRAGKQLRHLKA